MTNDYACLKEFASYVFIHSYTFANEKPREQQNPKRHVCFNLSVKMKITFHETYCNPSSLHTLPKLMTERETKWGFILPMTSAG